MTAGYGQEADGPGPRRGGPPPRRPRIHINNGPGGRGEKGLEFPGRILYNIPVSTCRCDGIGRRDGLKIRWWRHRVGSSPTTGTSSSQATYRLRRAFSFHCKEGDTRLRVSLGASGSPRERSPPRVRSNAPQGVRPAKRGLLRFQSSGGTASWKLAQVCSAASTCAQVYMARSHSAQVRYRK